MKDEREREYIEIIDRLQELAKSAYRAGRADERERWIEDLKPMTVVITIKARGGFDEVEAVRRVLTREAIMQGKQSLIQKEL
jgi:hypothetical protein